MKNHILTSIITAALVLPFSFVSAEEKGEKGKGAGKGRPTQGRGFQPPKFADIDADKSGDISKEEWIAFQVKAAQERAERSFGYLAGEDGKITEEELQKMMQRRGGSKGGPGKGGKGKGRPGGDAGGGDKPKRPPVEN